MKETLTKSDYKLLQFILNTIEETENSEKVFRKAGKQIQKAFNLDFLEIKTTLPFLEKEGKELVTSPVFQWHNTERKQRKPHKSQDTLSYPLSCKEQFFGQMTISRETGFAKHEIKCISLINQLLSQYCYERAVLSATTYALKKQTIYDSVTGLLRYEYFMEQAEKLRKKKPYYVLVYSDISNFKYINDTFGFAKGNEILNDFAMFLEAKGQNHICSCRIGSDHIVSFIALNKGNKKLDILRTIEDKNLAFSNQERKKFPSYKISIYSGIFFSNNKNISIADAIANANLARKYAKQWGTFCEIYDEQMNQDLTRKIKYREQLQNALENNEFQVFYQPKVDSLTKEIIGAEALIRWIKPDGTFIMPDEFIPVFEQSGEIIALDFFVYQHVCEYLSNRLKKKLSVVPISMNVSRLHLHNKNFLTFIEKLLEEYRIPPSLLEFEITERIYVEDFAQTKKIVTKLHKLGVRVSIDDFGSGYSSLNILTKIHCDVLKLDRIFLDTNNISPKNRLVIETVIKMAKGLHLSVICEGVETENQAAFLEYIGCTHMQGFLYSKPITEKELEQKLEQKPEHLNSAV